MLLRSLPPMSRPHAAIELSAWALMAVPMGVLSGGVAGVLANTVFGNAAPAWIIAIAVALLTGAGPLANMGSLAWAHWSLGRAKVGAVNRLQLLLAFALVAAAFAPLNWAGLTLFVIAILTAQVLWSGIITIRGSIWRLNYDRSARFAFAADNQSVVSLIHALTGALTGWLIEIDAQLFRALLIVGGLCALVSLWRLKRVRVRRQARLLRAETLSGDGGNFGFGRYLAILRDDALYRRYMICMMVLGTGNLMFTAPLILIMNRELGISSFSQILITAALPTLIVPLSARYWGRVLTRVHVIGFRSLNSRWYAFAIAIAAGGVLFGQEWILWVASVVLGGAIGGGMLGWNLGHNDFAPESSVADYLGIHVSLTGIRGLLAPLIGVWFYGFLESTTPGLGRWALLLPLALTTLGSISFWRFSRAHT
jgi:hypothetical protein